MVSEAATSDRQIIQLQSFSYHRSRVRSSRGSVLKTLNSTQRIWVLQAALAPVAYQSLRCKKPSVDRGSDPEAGGTA